MMDYPGRHGVCGGRLSHPWREVLSSASWIRLGVCVCLYLWACFVCTNEVYILE